MRKSAFVKKVLAKMPGFVNTDTFFYLSPFEHILSGFCCEITAHGAYLWRFVYPLYDKFEGLSLLYSFRLPGVNSYIDFDRISRDHLAEEFTLRVAGHLDEAKQCLTLPQFMNYLDMRPGVLENAHSEMVYGYTKLLMDQKDLALHHLRDAIKRLREPYSSQCQTVLDLAKIDLNRAKEMILGFEVEMKNMLCFTERPSRLPPPPSQS